MNASPPTAGLCPPRITGAAAERRRRVLYGPIAGLCRELERTPPTTAELDGMNVMAVGRLLDRLQDEVDQRRECSPLFGRSAHEDGV